MTLTTSARHVSRIGLALLILASVLAATQSPASALLALNDDFASPTVVGSLPFQAAQNTRLATTQDGEPDECYIDATVWYRFTPTTDTLVSVNTSGSDFDTVVGVYTGSELSTLDLVGCKDDDNYPEVLTSNFTWVAKAGVPYQIQVGGYSGTGNLNLSVTGQKPPVIPNNDLSSATLIGGIPFSATQSTLGATLEPDEPRPCEIGNTVWYRLKTRQDTPLQIATDGSDFDTVVAVYTGSQMSDLSLVGCNDESGEGSTSRLSWTAQAKTDYLIQVGGWDGAHGALTLNVTEEVEPHSPPGKSKGPRNDHFEDAIAIRRVPSELSQSTVGATFQDGEPWGPCGAGSSSVWYSFKPRKSGVVSLDTAGSNFDTALAVYTSDQLSTLQQVTCNRDDHTTGSRIAKLSWTAEAGVQYYIQAGGWPTGDLEMSISQTQ